MERERERLIFFRGAETTNQMFDLYFPILIGNVIIKIDELIFFRGVGLNHQPVDVEADPVDDDQNQKSSMDHPESMSTFCSEDVCVFEKMSLMYSMTRSSRT